MKARACSMPTSLRWPELAPLCDGEVLLYSTSADNAAVAAHRAEGEGRAVFVRAGQVILATVPPASACSAACRR